MDLKNNEFIGIIREGIDGISVEGKYLIYIPELMASDETLKPVWLKNEVQGNRFSRWLDLSAGVVLSSGSYYPLQPGMTVNIKFRSDELESGYITNVISHIPLPDTIRNRDTFYLLNKTTKNSWIYQDDNRGITHLMHNAGTSNVILDDDGITLHVGTPINNGIAGTSTENALSVGKSGTKLEFGNNSIIIDETGIMLTAGNSVISLTENGIQVLSTGQLDLVGEKNVNVKGKNLFLTGVEELHTFSNVTRLTGNQQLTLASNVITLDGVSSTFIKGGQVTIEGLIKTKIKGPIFDLSALTNLSMSAPLLTISSQMLTLTGASTVLNGASIFMDGMITHGLSTATATANAMTSMNIGLDLGTDAANMAIVTSLGMNDMISGVVNSVLTSTVTGVARPVGEIMRPVIVPADIGIGVSEKITYVAGTDASYNQIVKEPFSNLREKHNIKL